MILLSGKRLRIIIKKSKKSEEEQGEKWKRKFATFYLRFIGTKILYHKKAQKYCMVLCVKESDDKPVFSACSSFVFHSSATSFARGSSGFGALIKAWIDNRTVRICNAGLHLSGNIQNKENRLTTMSYSRKSPHMGEGE